MANFNGNSNPDHINLLPIEFAHTALDLDWNDDEVFRAGYPFSDIPEMESNEGCESYNINSIFADNFGQPSVAIPMPKENDQLTELSVQRQKKKVDGQLGANLTDARNKNYEIHPSQLINYDNEELDDGHQNDVKNQISVANIESLQPLDHAQTKN
ncbi:unnamed protein product [Adineta steineri]|uniref:Uncharacterized protein n=1 Tax=Adineta steineri TaxID=433720 RepID=A0A816E4I0_9BILA|nr:unnamed protein product [Adineta steineri]CAF1645105.1 unnamed protein product [Adineta steineri]